MQKAAGKGAAGLRDGIMGFDDDFNKDKNRINGREADEGLFDDVEIESEELFPEDEDQDISTNGSDQGADEEPFFESGESEDGFESFESGDPDDEEDDIVGDLDMEDKLLRTGMGRSEGRSEGRRHRPRELNTAGSVMDGRRHRTERDKKKGSRIKRIIICAIVELLTLCVIFGYGYVLRTFNLMARTEVDVAAVENENISMEKKQEMEGYWNIAVFGLDASQRNSDVVMIVSINQDTGDIKLVSVFRDTYLNISSKDQYNKINQAYAQGGPEQGLAALNKNLDLNITSYVTFNWETIAEIINLLGGVDDIDISKAEFYYINAYITETVQETGIASFQLKSAGTQHLDGVQAVAYARLRLMDSDFARTERQKKIIKACFEKAKTVDYSVLNYIMLTCFPEVETNISLGEVVNMAQGILRYNIADTGGFPWSRGDARIPNKGACVIPTTLESNVVMLHEFLFGDENYQVSDAVLRYSDKIKQDSNLYKEGKPIESVATDQGVIQKPKTSAAEEVDEDDDETEAPTEREQSTEGYTFGVDEDGRLIYPTDENGDYVIPTDENGDVIYPTDEDGNEIREGATYGTRPERPTDLAPIESEGDAGSEIVDDDGNVLGTSPTRETGRYPGDSTRPTENTRPSDSDRPGGTTRPVETDAAGRPIINNNESENPGPGETTTAARETSGSSERPGGGSSSGENQGSSITDIPDEPVTVPQTTTAASTVPTAPAGSQQGPGGGSSAAASDGMQSVTGPGV